MTVLLLNSTDLTVVHSVRNDFTGLAIAALIAWKLTVNKVITNAPVLPLQKSTMIILYGIGNSATSYA